MTWDCPGFLRFIPRSTVLNVATVWKVGLVKRAPGTFGSIVGILWYIVAFWRLNAFEFAFLYILSNYISVLFCGEAEAILGKTDPECVILDEVCAMPLCFFNMPDFTRYIANWKVLLLGFVLFRVFDIFKPFGIKKLQKYPRGIGIVIDDIAAALATFLCLQIVFLMIKS